MPAELMEAPAPRDGAYAEAGQGGGIPPPPAWGPRRPPRRGSRGSPQGSRRRARPSGEGARGPDLPLERGRALGEPYPEHTGCPGVPPPTLPLRCRARRLLRRETSRPRAAPVPLEREGK